MNKVNVISIYLKSKLINKISMNMLLYIWIFVSSVSADEKKNIAINLCITVMKLDWKLTLQ